MSALNIPAVDIGRELLSHSARAVSSIATTTFLGYVFTSMTMAECTVLGICGSVAWSITNIACRSFGASVSLRRNLSIVGGVVLGIPLAGFVFALLPINPSVLSFGLLGFYLVATAISNVAYGLLSILAITLSMMRNRVY